MIRTNFPSLPTARVIRQNVINIRKAGHKVLIWFVSSFGLFFPEIQLNNKIFV